jgi:hypothetical protein
LVAKSGSNATPSNPRSPEELTLTVRKGVASSAPFLMTRSAPACWHTKMRPSGAMAIAVGDERPLATTLSLNPAGTVAARAATGIARASSAAVRVCEMFRIRVVRMASIMVSLPLAAVPA